MGEKDEDNVDDHDFVSFESTINSQFKTFMLDDDDEEEANDNDDDDGDNEDNDDDDDDHDNEDNDDVDEGEDEDDDDDEEVNEDDDEIYDDNNHIGRHTRTHTPTFSFTHSTFNPPPPLFPLSP